MRLARCSGSRTVAHGNEVWINEESRIGARIGDMVRGSLPMAMRGLQQIAQPERRLGACFEWESRWPPPADLRRYKQPGSHGQQVERQTVGGPHGGQME